MAGVGPAPKDVSERRRANKPARGEWIDITKPELDRDEIVLPDLTVLEKGKLNHKAKDTWRVWRREPVTLYWSKADIKAAKDILELYNQDDWTRSAAEIRQRETALALNPKGKRDLRFRITFGKWKESTKDDAPVPENVVQLDARRNSLQHTG